MQPLCSRHDDIGKRMLALSVPDAVHGVVETFLV